MYFPGPGRAGTAARALAGGRDVVLHTRDHLRLGAWYLPPPGREDGVCVLVAPGNGGDRTQRVPLAQALSRRGLAVLLLDYRGYGGNPGTPSEQGLALDVRAAHDLLTAQAGFSPDRLVYLGESLGAAVVTELAAERPPRGLVLRSPFTDLASVGRVHYPYLPVGRLLHDRYPLLAHLRRVTAPVTVVLGTADTVVPPEQSRRVARAAPRPADTVVVEGADHNDPVLVAGAALADAVALLAGRAV